MNWQASITVRLSLAFAALAVLVFATLGVYLARSADRHMAELDAHALMGKLALAKHIAGQEATPAALARRMADALVGEHGIRVLIVEDEETIFSWPLAARQSTLRPLAANVGETPVRLGNEQGEFRMVAADLETGWGTVVRVIVARDIHHHTDFLDQMQRDFWIAVLAAFLLTVIVGFWLVRQGMRPVRDIAEAAGRISVGQLAERIPEQGVPPELAAMVAAFNGMLARLEASFSRLSDFSADLAHELRTPIHALRMQTEVLLAKPRTVDEYHELMASNLEEYERLARMIADMLFLAKADHGLLVPNTERLDLRPLGERLIDYYGLLAEGLNLQLSGDSVWVQGDALMLERAIGNVLLNAINHTPPGGEILLAISRFEGVAEVRVSNSGQPIPPAALARVFERFARLDSRSEGNGLGLAIVRSIMQAHHGDVSVSVLDAHTVFSLSLPASD